MQTQGSEFVTYRYVVNHLALFTQNHTTRIQTRTEVREEQLQKCLAENPHLPAKTLATYDNNLTWKQCCRNATLSAKQIVTRKNALIYHFTSAASGRRASKKI